MAEEKAKPDNIQRECRFAIHIPKKNSDRKDIHLIKEELHYPDGTHKPNVRFIADYPVNFWVTQSNYRDHQQKKEYEECSKLIPYRCTASELDRAVAKALDKGWSNARLQQLSESQFLYGSDVSSTTLIKNEISKTYPDAISPYRVAFLDFETNVVDGSNDPIIGTYICDNELLAVIDKRFLSGFTDPLGRIKAMMERDFNAETDRTKQSAVIEYKDDQVIVTMLQKSKPVKSITLNVSIIFVDTPVELIETIIRKAHEQSPDFVAIWNMDFDVPMMLATLKKYGVDAKDVFCHPSLPPPYRFCTYKKGTTRKVTASGKVMPKNPSEQWHSLLVPAGFYIIDAMCSYRFIRQGAQEEKSFDLDSILTKEKVGSKLKHEPTKYLKGLDYHHAMQTKFHIEYITYAMMDVIGMLALETKTNDLAQALPVQCRSTDFARFNSQTKRFADRYHFFLLERGKVVATVPPRPKEDEELDLDDIGEDDEEDEDDDDEDDENKEPEQKRTGVLSLIQWIVTLPAHLSVLGAKLIKECKTLCTLIRRMVYDSDAVSAYPSATMVANVSRTTTSRELIDILGIDEEVFRKQNINLLQGHVNAIEYCCAMHKLPTPQEALKYFEDL